MDYQEAIKELDILNEHCFDMIDKEDKESIWIKDCEALNVAISAIQALQEYQKLGTLEEVREAVERQRAKKLKRDCIYHHPTRWCEKCKRVVLSGWKYCPDCGQAIDWSEEDE